MSSFGMELMLWLAEACEYSISWTFVDGSFVADAGECRLIGTVIYWYLWTVLIPRWRGYRIEEEADVLEDGTSIIKLVRTKID